MDNSAFYSRLSITLLLCLTGCSSQPKSATLTDTPTNVIAPSAAKATEVAAANFVSSDTYAKAKALGFHPRVRAGLTVFCHNDAVIGTHFKSERCIKPETVDLEMELAAQLRQKSGQVRPCAGTSCGTN